ncbi:MAG: hypothetical protein JXA30_19055 [Deltaproteobacteria bacterium]|nr:hypothetical protein [Deltaproteobacteria bacterium]
MKPAETVLKFLESIGLGAEARFYLKLFRSDEKQRFAVIVVDPSTLQQTTDAVALDLRFLTVLGLTPIVVFGRYQNGDSLLHAENLRLKLDQAHLSNAFFLFDGDASPIVDAVNRESLPLVIIDASEPDDWFRRLGELVSILRTRKLLFLCGQGGLTLREEPLSVVNLSREYDSLISRHDFSDDQRVIIERSRQLIFDLVPHKLLIAVTSPLNLLHELFTIKGAGTLLRKGTRILSRYGYHEIDVPRLRVLLENGFERPINDDFFSRPISRVYVEEDYRGVALLQDTDLGGYLTKFAVTTEARGEGIGRDLWHFVTNDYPAVIWRARPENPITPWYEQQCDGRLKTGNWTVYFRGLDTARIPEAVAYALQQPIDFYR